MEEKFQRKRKWENEEFLSLDEKIDEHRQNKNIPNQFLFSSPCQIPSHSQDFSLVNRKIFVGGLSPTTNENILNKYFSQFGSLESSFLSLDKDSGKSKGFAVVVFESESIASSVLGLTHFLEGKVLSVSLSRSSSSIPVERVIPAQNFIFVGPIDYKSPHQGITQEERETNIIQKLKEGFSPFGSIQKISLNQYTVSRMAKITFINFISVKRVFGKTIEIEGQSYLTALSSFALQLLLSSSVLYFTGARIPISGPLLEKFFSDKFGSVFRARDFSNYGFVDFVSESSVRRALLRNSLLLPPGIFVTLTKTLPYPYLLDLLAIGESESLNFEAEHNSPSQSSWGLKSSSFHLSDKNKNEIRKSRFKIPFFAFSALLRERGKRIAEISRDSKCLITIPKTVDSSPNVILTIQGTSLDITTALYLIQKAIKNIAN